MSSFIATPTLEPSAAEKELIRNDGFFPDISLAELRATMRLDGTVTNERLREATIGAIDSVNNELHAWRAQQISAGFSTLADIPAANIDGQSVQLIRYRRAVFNLTHADITERYRDWDTTKSGGQKAEDIESTIGQARRNVRWALSDLRGLARTTVELI
ncbi:head completion/stabilization protein [Caballeronia sp. HLA56]